MPAAQGMEAARSVPEHGGGMERERHPAPGANGAKVPLPDPFL